MVCCTQYKIYWSGVWVEKWAPTEGVDIPRKRRENPFKIPPTLRYLCTLAYWDSKGNQMRLLKFRVDPRRCNEWVSQHWLHYLTSFAGTLWEFNDWVWQRQLIVDPLHVHRQAKYAVILDTYHTRAGGPWRPFLGALAAWVWWRTGLLAGWDVLRPVFARSLASLNSCSRNHACFAYVKVQSQAPLAWFMKCVQHLSLANANAHT